MRKIDGLFWRPPGWLRLPLMFTGVMLAFSPLWLVAQCADAMDDRDPLLPRLGEATLFLVASALATFVMGLGVSGAEEWSKRRGGGAPSPARWLAWAYLATGVATVLHFGLTGWGHAALWVRVAMTAVGAPLFVPLWPLYWLKLAFPEHGD